MGVREWPWWRLLVRLTPLLDVHRTEHQLKEAKVRGPRINIYYILLITVYDTLLYTTKIALILRIFSLCFVMQLLVSDANSRYITIYVAGILIYVSYGIVIVTA